MKRLIAVGVALAIVSFAFAPASFAGIVGSRHDMTGAPYAPLVAFATYGACSPCHIPHGAGADRLFPNTVAAAGSGFFGPLCQSCHDQSINNDVNTYTNFTVLDSAHGLSNTALRLMGDHEAVATSGLEYVTQAQSPRATPVDEIECLSCHDVHNQDSNRPFLQAPLNTLCQMCHTNRDNNAVGTTGWNNAAGGSGSTHPSGATFTGDVSGIAIPAGGDSPFVASWGAELVSTNDDTDTNGSTWSDTNVWNSGLQLHDQSATGGVACMSCHNVHWDEDDGTPNLGMAYLAIVDDEDAGDATATVDNDFCEYCHQGSNAGSADGAFWNPGATAFSHPNDDIGAIATVPSALAWQPTTSSPMSSVNGASGLVCTSCHGLHPGDSTGSETELNSPIFLQYDEVANGAPNIGGLCAECHIGAFATQHHPIGGAYGTNGNNAGGVTCAGGDLAPGIGMCHGQGANGVMAHNRTEAMTGNSNDSANCIACHSTNPGLYVDSSGYPTANGEASHYLGDTNTEGWRNGRSTDPGDTTIRFAAGAAAWGASSLPSLFGANPSTMICESCHRLADGNISSGDGATTLLVEESGAESDVGDSTAAYNYAASPNMCGGCHLIPGGTHPLTEANDASYAISGGAGQTYMAAGGMNCESCHSPHDAVTESGSYILDGGAAVTLGTGTGMQVEPPIDYTTFCAVCHGAFQ